MIGECWNQPKKDTPCLRTKEELQQEATVRTGHRTTDWFKIGNGVCRGCTLSPAYLTSVQSTSWETQGWRKLTLESRLPGEISVTSDMQMTPPYWQKVKRNQSASWWMWKRRKNSLKTQHSKNQDQGIQSHHLMANRWGNSDRLYFHGLQNHHRRWL